MEKETSVMKENNSKSAADDYSAENKNFEYEVKANETVPLAGEERIELKEKEGEVMWAEELKNDINTEFLTMTKREYFRFCSQLLKRLQIILSDEMTDAYKDFSLLFKNFRFTYAQSLKLLSKVRELQTVNKLLENKNHDQKEELDTKDEKETELKTMCTSVRNAIAETVKQKIEVERERDELQQKLSQIPEEIIEAAGEYSLTTATEEKNKLNSKIEELEEKIAMMEEDFEHVKVREEIFHRKYQEAKTLHSSYEEELVAIKREIMYHIQKKENAELLMGEKRIEIKNNLSTIERLKKDIAKMQEEIEKGKQTHRRVFNEKLTFKRAFHDSERAVRQLRNEHNARQFQVTVMKARKKNLEDDAEKLRSQIHTLKIENAKLSKERSQFSWHARMLEDDLKKLKADFEEASLTIKNQISEMEQFEKEKQLTENEYKEAIRQLMKNDEEFRIAQNVIKNLQSDKKVLENNKELLSKNLQAKVLQVEELDDIIAKNRSEKNNLVQNIADLNSKVALSQELLKVLEQRCAEYDYKTIHLQKDLQNEKEQYKLLNDIHREIVNQYKSMQRKLEETKYLYTMVAQRNNDQIGQISNLEDKHDKMEKHVTTLKVKIRNIRSAQAQEEMRCHKLLEQLDQKEKENITIMKDMDEKQTHIYLLKTELQSSTNERDALKLKLDERNVEMKAKDEDIRIKQRDLSKFEQLLNDRNNDIRLLKTEIEQLRRREAILKNQKSDVDKLRIEISAVHRQLLDEKLKSKTMEEEIQKPQNVHRWRILESEDPSKAHLITRNLKLQKDLVKKSEELLSKERELLDKSRQVTELQEYLKKIVEMRADGKSWTLKKELQAFKERIKSLTAENSMYQNITSALQTENEKLKTETRKLKISAHKQNFAAVKAT